MSRRVHTADDVLRHALTGATELVVTPGDRLTPLARDVANEHGLRIVVSDGFATARPEQAPPRQAPPVGRPAPSRGLDSTRPPVG